MLAKADVLVQKILVDRGGCDVAVGWKDVAEGTST